MQARHNVVLYFKTFQHDGTHGTESGREGSIKPYS